VVRFWVENRTKIVPREGDLTTAQEGLRGPSGAGVSTAPGPIRGPGGSRGADAFADRDGGDLALEGAQLAVEAALEFAEGSAGAKHEADRRSLRGRVGPVW